MAERHGTPAQEAAWEAVRRKWRFNAEARRGYTYEEMYGPERAAEIKAKISASQRARGRNLEEKFGPERAAEIRAKIRRGVSSRKGIPLSEETKSRISTSKKGRSYVDLYGPEGAAEQRAIRSESISRAMKAKWAIRKGTR